MRFNKISLKDSFELVKKKRPEICPNKSFFRQLIESEKELFNPENPSITYNDYLVLLIQHSLPDLSVEQIKEAFLLSDQDVIKTETFLLKKYFGLK
ncbi:hypothetical protein M0811_11106 [Anaeramoeba ignava]|uniref:Uncharacterized protein n=1 Tax=Anaeramoeba ignava TaxID=1746090 RepID=A0A9Q0R8D1_ANAIG|nr:hypothetical protein M0811_11106 [Anaeramoeba ignava]